MKRITNSSFFKIIKGAVLKNRLYILSCFILVSVISFAGCSQLIDSLDKPDTLEKNTMYKIVLKDKSGYLKKVYGSDLVANAEVMLKSNMYKTEITAVSDSAGAVYISGALSDKYFITADRALSADEMYKATGEAMVNYKLTNKDAGVIELNASNSAPVELNLSVSIGESPLVFSELYVCGPSGSGLYYHDKYVEVYNNSDSVIYLDKILLALVYVKSDVGISYVNDPEYIHTRNVWMFPGNGKDYPIKPGQYVVCAEDAIDHRFSAPNSVDLSKADFEFYKEDSPDIDNPKIPNMVKIFQAAGNDWTPAAEKGAMVLAQYPADSLKVFDDHYIFPIKSVIEGVEYLKDVTKINEKILTPLIDPGATGGIQFYTGKSMERIIITKNGKQRLKDTNNSTLDFKVYDHPSPGYHN